MKISHRKVSISRLSLNASFPIVHMTNLKKTLYLYWRVPTYADWVYWNLVKFNPQMVTNFAHHCFHSWNSIRIKGMFAFNNYYLPLDFKQMFSISTLPFMYSSQCIQDIFLRVYIMLPFSVEMLPHDYQRHGLPSIGYRSYGSQAWPIKGNALSSKQQSYRYC